MGKYQRFHSTIRYNFRPQVNVTLPPECPKCLTTVDGLGLQEDLATINQLDQYTSTKHACKEYQMTMCSTILRTEHSENLIGNLHSVD